jgi:hypothetical protein
LPAKTESLAKIRQGSPFLFSPVQNSGKATGVCFASGRNQDSVMPVYSSCHFALGLDKNKDEQPTQIRESRFPSETVAFGTDAYAAHQLAMQFQTRTVAPP